jgi:hypothetical protein
VSKIIPFVIGGLELAAGIAIEVITPGNPAGWYLIAAGAGAIIGGVGTLLSQPQGGLSAQQRNPVQPWNVVYGRAKVAGTVVYINSFGDSDKYLDMVFVLASHPCLSIDSLCFDNKRIPLDSNNCSYTPTQQTVNITSIVRAYGIVTVTTAAAISDLEPGDQVQIQNISGTGAFDRSLNGVVYVYQVFSTTSFSYLSGGLDITLGTTGQVHTLWPDYRAKVYCEFLNGEQTATFAGLMNGTPYDGDPSNLVVPDPGTSPWSDGQHILNGKACAFIRLHYNDEVWSSGVPQISFRLRGKKNIYDPRNDTSVAEGIVLLNGWGPYGHEGNYEGGIDLGYTWGTDSGTTNPYGGVAQATDGNPSSWCAQSYRHTHQYCGCVWTFPSVTTATYINVLSSVPSSGPGSLRSASLFYSLDGGTTWTEIYDAAVRAEQWDNVALAPGQDTTQVQVMAFMDSHDDMTHLIYEVQLGSGPQSTVAGYTENSALCIADYLANTTWGFKATYGDEIPLPPLISAANICDEAVDLSDGTTEPRYQCDGGFQLTASRGEILQNMLTSCSGRITYSGGQFIIWPAAWAGVSLGLGAKIPSTVVFSIITSHIPGVSAGGNGDITRNVDPGTAPCAQFDYFCYDPSAWTQRTDSDTLDYDPSTQLVTIHGSTGSTGGGDRISTLQNLCVTIYSCSTLLSASTPGDIMEVYDCRLDLTYPDGSTAVMKPTQAISIVHPVSFCHGYVTNPQYAVDGDGTTYASVERVEFSPFPQTSPALQLTDFQIVSVAGPPDLGQPGVEESREVLGITAGPFTWKSKLPIRELYNGCKGQYISPANGWQNSDFPQYAQDADHGYSGPAAFDGDQNLADDGGDRRWLEIQLPFTISPFTAQRLAKIELMRKRQQGTGTFAFNMSLYQATALDIVAMTLPILGWSAKLLEVTSHRLMFNRAEGGPTLGCELDLQETDPSVYEWSVSEELAPQGPGLGTLPVTNQTAGVAGVTATSGTTTSVVGADGVARSQILVTWPAPTDAFVLSGGQVEIQYQQVSSPAGPWTAGPTVAPNVTQAYIGGVTDGAQYVVQVRFVNAAGSPSDWTASAPVTVSGAASSLSPANIAQGGAAPGQVLTWTGPATGWLPSTLPTSAGTFTTETPTGAQDNANKFFFTARAPISGSLHVYVNGVEQVPGVNIQTGGSTIEFAFPPKPADVIVAAYSY